jgi:uncharacterized protein (DUF924 family)
MCVVVVLATPEVILDFVFGHVVQAPDAELDNHVARWFRATQAFDREIAEKFGATIESALAGELDHFITTPQGRLALIILLDQFTRNVFRDTPRAFSGDSRALVLCRQGLAFGVDKGLAAVHRHFFYLPLLHAEDRGAQLLSVQCFEQLVLDAPPHQHALFSACADAARLYRDVIFRFGRFPHRNDVLRRDSTEEERQLMCDQTEAMPRYAKLRSNSASHAGRAKSRGVCPPEANLE